MAINELINRFSGNPKKEKRAPEKEFSEQADDLEALIDKAGRSKVFARARQLGWLDGNMPPIWVWRGICYEVMKEGE